MEFKNKNLTTFSRINANSSANFENQTLEERFNDKY